MEEVQKLLEFELGSGDFRLSDEQKAMILEAKNDKVLTKQEANADIESWLKEQ